MTVNHKDYIQICCETSCSFSGNTSGKTGICCRKVELKSTLRSTLPQLATLYFVARQVGHKRGNTCNNMFQMLRDMLRENVARITGP